MAEGRGGWGLHLLGVRLGIGAVLDLLERWIGWAGLMLPVDTELMLFIARHNNKIGPCGYPAMPSDTRTRNRLRRVAA
jgi:hypothetical protein